MPSASLGNQLKVTGSSKSCSRSIRTGRGFAGLEFKGGQILEDKGRFLDLQDERQVKMSKVQVHGLGKGILDNLEPHALFLASMSLSFSTRPERPVSAKEIRSCKASRSLVHSSFLQRWSLSRIMVCDFSRAKRLTSQPRSRFFSKHQAWPIQVSRPLA